MRQRPLFTYTRHSNGSEVCLSLPVGLQEKKTQKLAMHAGGGTVMGDAEVEDQTPAPGLISKIVADLYVAAPLASKPSVVEMGPVKNPVL